MIALHGRTWTASSFRELSQLDQVADSKNFIIAYPDGEGTMWNAGNCCSTIGTDDVTLISGMIDSITSKYNIDKTRVWVLGWSNGAMMAYRAACEISEKVTAIAVGAGTFAANCVLARRLAEKGVRFIQLYHQGWDHHGDLPGNARYQAKLTDKASAALIIDLKRRGLLDDTLVIWGGEFGRTAYSQGAISKDNYGRDHHPRCFSLWMAGAGMKRGFSYGRTDDYGYNLLDKSGNVITPSKDKFVPGVVHVHDLQATILDQLGIDHHQLTYRNQGRDYRLTDVHGHVVTDLLS
jgi:pimeloyl-ACP methyl ester carboxylesterase